VIRAGFGAPGSDVALVLHAGCGGVFSLKFTTLHGLKIFTLS
jgi:hypothetical protein